MPWATVTPSITPYPTEEITPTAEVTPSGSINPPVQEAIIVFNGPDGQVLVNYEIEIDGTKYTTNEKGEVKLTDISVGEHQARIDIEGNVYFQSFILGTNVQQQRIAIDITNNSVSPLIYIGSTAVAMVCIMGIVVYFQNRIRIKKNRR